MNSNINSLAFKVMARYMVRCSSASNELEMGKKVEREHKDIYDLLSKKLKGKVPISEDEFYEAIAKAHLRELPDYYTRLKKMEGGAHKEAMDFSSIAPLMKTDRPLDDREIARALRLAIAAEHDAAHLYELIADSTKEAKVKEVLQDVANEEKVHVGELEKLLSLYDKKDQDFLEEGRKEVEEMSDKGEEDED